jgi:hypothetical protein
MSWLNRICELHICLAAVYLLKMGARIYCNNGHLLCFRWLELHVESRKVSGQTKLAVPNNRHEHHQT